MKHTLSGSEYPDRVKQCKAAVEILKKENPTKNITALRDVNIEMLEAAKQQMPTIVYRRARHCIGEDRRTLATVDALALGDFDSVGKHMLQSHVSLKEDYEVSCSELDLLVELAMEVDGVYGSRMTGGGFGGCTVTLVKKSAVPTLREFLKENYRQKTGKDCDCYEAVPSAGAQIIDMSTPDTDSNTFANAPTIFGRWLLPIAVAALAVSVGIHFARKH